MKRAPLCRSLVAVVCLLLAAPAWGAKNDPSISLSAGVNEARTLVLQRNCEEALAILRPMARGGAVDAVVLFHIGLAAVGASQKLGVSEDLRAALLNEAIASFRSMLIGRPELVRVRLALARAFFLKGEDKLATRHFEQVLAGKPPAAVALNFNRFLNLMRARKRWSLRLGMALLPDTNVGSSSAERTILLDTPFGRLPFALDNYNGPKSGIGISVWIGGEYQYPLNERWQLRAGGNLSRKEYRESEFDQMTLSGHVGPRWLIGRFSEVSLLLSGLHQWTGSGIEEPSHHDIGFRVEGKRRLDRRTTVTARLSRHERRYDKDTHLDGPVTDVSVGAGWVASPTVRIDASAGWARERPETESRRHSRRWVQLGTTAQLPWGFTVGGSGTLRWVDSEGDWYPFTTPGQARSDLTRTIRLFAQA